MLAYAHYKMSCFFHMCVRACVSVSTEGGSGDPPGPGGSQRHPVPAEVHPGRKAAITLLELEGIAEL